MTFILLSRLWCGTLSKASTLPWLVFESAMGDYRWDVLGKEIATRCPDEVEQPWRQYDGCINVVGVVRLCYSFVELTESLRLSILLWIKSIRPFRRSVVEEVFYILTLQGVTQVREVWMGASEDGVLASHPGGVGVDGNRPTWWLIGCLWDEDAIHSFSVFLNLSSDKGRQQW